ncbi:alanine:cation symporter family protein [Parashewanella spongiae]|uniref:Alanine:cation symporter family protein n=1 Tax=Parashewanella spongiae TaxID=342950 RepID=A0A3A6TIR7_9GAMM|nr:alanine/glycine:cation symporter family protein [Parashewanella spongiae]MCL1079632.1 alanine:cation symporter family protein [Parashewanella spongiae]RJY06980.1 alanine:cation symporter family protein [Parashewanella spongiae]
MLEMIVNFLNTLLWGKLLVYGLVGAGLFFTIRLGLIQFTGFKHAAKLMMISRQNSGDGLSSFQVFCTSMAARVGAGNMAGVAVAIGAGGPGAVFWMWLIAVLGMATSMIEGTLAQVYKVKDDDGEFRGGPAYYMEKGLGQRWMGILFSVLLILSFGLIFSAVQANTMTSALTSIFDVSEMGVGIAVVIATAFVIVGGLRKVAHVSEVLVPIMAMVYILVSFIIVLMNISELPTVFMLVIKSAFGWQEVAAGGVAYAISQAMQAGIARGLFSNEAGMGSAANIAASATPNPNHPASQGYIQMMGVFIDTIVICTATAAIILLAGDLGNEHDGVALTIHALNSHIGELGSMFFAFAIMLFCFTSIIANYSYAETNILFIIRHNKLAIHALRFGVLGMVMFGAIAKIGLVWDLADVAMGLMAIVNIIALLLLSGVAVSVIKDYRNQIKLGAPPEFNSDKFPEIKPHLEEGIWKNTSKAEE